MSNEREKAQLGASTLKNFCESYGDDIHARILLEIIFQGIMNEEALFVFGKSEQTRHKTCDDFTRGINSNFENNGFDQIESSSNLGKKDSADYP